jgi:hypothetical protein
VMVTVYRHAGAMRYPYDGGLTAAERARREQVRLATAELIEAGPVTERWRGDIVQLTALSFRHRLTPLKRFFYS